MTGWRLGAAIGPAPIIDTIAKLNVNDESCTNQFIQYGAIEALTGDQSGHDRIIAILKERRDRAVDLLNRIPGVSCLRPSATFYLFPNVTGLMKAAGTTDYQAFRRQVLARTGVSFCTRTHFGRELPGEKERYIRLAYSGIDAPQIEKALDLLSAYARSLG
jgi:aspartate/methionine/tyrosine aminotransferase